MNYTIHLCFNCSLTMLKKVAPTTSISLPLYVQISELLTREIAAGHWVEGDRLPPEAELARTLDVAIGTLRKALSELDGRGLLERRQGSGTYVKPKSPAQLLAKNAPRDKSIYEFFRLELVRGGGLPTAAVIDFQKINKPDFCPEFASSSIEFKSTAKTTCYRVRRLRSLNSIPVAIEEIYFDARHASALALEDMGEALYLFYQQRLGFWISHTEDRIGAGAVPDWAPTMFTPTPGAVCPRIERISWSGKNTVEEYSITWTDPERCRYVNRLK
jgi:GntR family transcriptional regulator